MTWAGVFAGGIVGGVVIWRMLIHASLRGGRRGGDTTRYLGQVFSQNDAFRGSRSEQPWDGVERPSGMLGNTDGF